MKEATIVKKVEEQGASQLWREVAQLHDLAQLNFELAIAELERCLRELRVCLGKLDNTRRNLNEEGMWTNLVRR